MNPRPGSSETEAYVFLIFALQQVDIDVYVDCHVHPPRSVGEHCRTLADPVVERRGAGDPGVADELRLLERAGVEADRADGQLAAPSANWPKRRSSGGQPAQASPVASSGSASLTASFVSQIATCLPFSSAAVETRSATMAPAAPPIRSCSSRPMPRRRSARKARPRFVPASAATGGARISTRRATSPAGERLRRRSGRASRRPCD
jgi:hypothetical protein